MRVKIWPL